MKHKRTKVKVNSDYAVGDVLRVRFGVLHGTVVVLEVKPNCLVVKLQPSGITFDMSCDAVEVKLKPLDKEGTP